jgi:putative transposase
MPRIARIAPGGHIYHVLNRSVGRMHLFRRDADFEAFERILLQAHERHSLRILSYCLMSNHWHLVVWTQQDGQLTAFFRWLTHTHAMRWRVAHHTVGYGHLYQGRFKSFPIQRDDHLRTVCRYVERNALTAGLVKNAEDWRWGSLRVRMHGPENMRAILSPWPVDRPSDRVQHVNEALTAKELQRLELSQHRGRPYGGEAWVARTVAKLGMEHTIRPEGRPRKEKDDDNSATASRSMKRN